jgi:Calx-beta domain-containing protein
VTVTEGSAPSTVNATFTVTLSSAAPAAATITYRTADGSATSPADYTGVGNTSLPIAQNATSAQITIVVKGDGLPEGTNENFFVDLVATTGPVAISGDSRGTGTITDDDNPVTASINDVAVTEGHSGNVTATFTVTLSGPTPAPVTITYRTADGTATSPADYTGVPNTVLNIAQGGTSGQISIVVKGDTLPEGSGSPPAENFFVDLVGATGPATISADSRGTGTITDDDSPVTASINDVSVTEGHTPTTVNATFTVTLSGPAQAQVQIQYRTANGSAVAPGDYTAVSSGVLTISQGQSSGTFSIQVKGDIVPEGTGTPLTETFFVDLINASGPATISADSRGIGSIVDDDSPVTASIDDVSVTEGNAGTVTATFTVSLSGPASAPVQIRYSTLDSSAVAPGDYTAVSNALLSIAQGGLSGQFSIVVNGDTVFEGESETFFVDLISATGPATISADSRGRGTITDDEPAPPAPPGTGGGGGAVPSLSITDTLAREGVDASFTVTLTGDTTKTVTVRATTTNATANGGSDYVARDEVLTFAPGEKTKVIVLTVLDDTVPEETETFWVRLSQPTNATIAKTLGTATIEANDQVGPVGVPKPNGPLLPRMILGPPSVTVGANGVAVMRVTCTKASPIACIGLVALETTTKPKFQLGKKKFVAKKGKRTSVQIRLSARALKRLLKTGTLRVRAIVVVRNSAKKTVRFVPGVVTLRASKALMTKPTVLNVAEPKVPDTKVEIVP